jgi:hypothetical protein
VSGGGVEAVPLAERGEEGPGRDVVGSVNAEPPGSVGVDVGEVRLEYHVEPLGLLLGRLDRRSDARRFAARADDVARRDHGWLPSH